MNIISKILIVKIEKKVIRISFLVQIIISIIILWAFLYFGAFVIGEAFYNLTH